ncbi:PD40 domain-containing protein [Myxosarcina sp. GI1]|uniref:TolB family protein n=1 Tax=Myxosarcina sp. GI1 TaxID=1541065 RepID=UPI00056CD136|nr:PD40 domain-containing protein [Myxosarcina sp. GI1]
MKLVKSIWLKLLYFAVVTSIGGCDRALFVETQVIPGGINSNSIEEHPAYSSNGRYLAFASDRRGHRDIFLYDLQQRNLVSLPNLNRRNSRQDSPSLNADGNYIAYVSTERGKTDIMLYDRAKQRSQLLSVNVRGSVSNPTINGDGSKVAFQTSQLGQWKIAIVDTNVVSDGSEE